MLNPIIPPPPGRKMSCISSLGWGTTEGMSSKLPGLHWEYEGTEGNKYTSKPIYVLSYLITYGFLGASQGQSLWETKCCNWLTLCQQDSFFFLFFYIHRLRLSNPATSQVSNLLAFCFCHCYNTWKWKCHWTFLFPHSHIKVKITQRGEKSFH